MQFPVPVLTIAWEQVLQRLEGSVQSCWQSIHTLSVGDVGTHAVPVIAECGSPAQAHQLTQTRDLGRLWEEQFREALLITGADTELLRWSYPIMFVGTIATDILPTFGVPRVRDAGAPAPLAAPLVSPAPLPYGLNNVALPAEQIYFHDGVRFRSPAEPPIYDALKKRNVLFFPNALAVLGGKMLKREPDFLICDAGRWGILEVMGAAYHQDATKDHERARLFKDYRLLVIEFYAATQCMQAPDAVVDDFLRRLKDASPA